jgi:hypothetical protein
MLQSRIGSSWMDGVGEQLNSSTEGRTGFDRKDKKTIKKQLDKRMS